MCVNEGSNENFDGIGGYQDRSGSDRGDFRGRSFWARGQCDDFGPTIETV